MATSGSFTTTSCEGRSLTFSWSLQSQSVANNTSTISWKLYGSGSYSGYVMGGPFTVVINGSTVYSSSNRIQVWAGNTQTTTVASGTATIGHNSDGTKSFSASVSAAIYSFSVNCSGSGSWSLTTIPRASTISSASNITLGNKCGITWTPASKDFQYDIKFTLGNWSASTGKRQPNTTSSYTYNYTIPADDDTLSQIPNSTTGTMTATLYTYNASGTQIGSASSKTFTVTVPSSVVPTVGTISLDPVNITTNDGTSRNILVQGKNRLTVSVSGCSAGTGSSIKSYTFSGPGISSTTTNTSVTSSGTISNTGTLTYTVKVTDNRGRTASKSKTITCYAYATPYFKSFSAYRCDINGKADSNGTYIKYACSWAYSSVNATNNTTVKLQYKKNTTTSWTSVGVVTNSTSTGTNGIIDSAIIDLSSTYVVRAVVTDNYKGSSNSSIVTLFSASRILNITSDGTGVAFGKMAESKELFDVKWKTQFRSDVVIDGNLIASGLQKVTALYTGSTAGTIQKTLASGDSIDNYKYLEILYTDNDSNGHNSVKIYSPNGRKIDLSLIEPSDTTASRTYIRRTMYTIAGDGNILTITPSSTSRGYVQIDGAVVTQTVTDSNYIRIINVLGYK